MLKYIKCKKAYQRRLLPFKYKKFNIHLHVTQHEIHTTYGTKRWKKYQSKHAEWMDRENKKPIIIVI